MTACKTCGREYEYKQSAGHKKEQCNSCQTNARRFELKKKLVTQFGGACKLCGYSRCLEALVFHHLDPATKLFELSGAHSRSQAALQSEVAKCVLLCANCHSEVHTGKVVL
jgi:hypothetical protein